jgi:hypothetical protein
MTCQASMRCVMREVGYDDQRILTLGCVTVLNRSALERAAKEGDSPVNKKPVKVIFVHPSTMEHVKFCGNLRRPWRKAKYSLMTDSEQVP